MPDPSPTFVTSQGTTFTFKGNTYKCIDIGREGSAPARERVDMTTLDVAHGGEAVMLLSPIKPKRDPKKFTITYRTMSDTTEIEEGAEGTLTTTGGSGNYRVTAAGVSRKTAAYVEGTATFEELIAGEVTASNLTIS
jgi:hypothetical protein